MVKFRINIKTTKSLDKLFKRFLLINSGNRITSQRSRRKITVSITQCTY